MPDPKHVLLVNYEYPPLGGGGGVINALFAEELAKRIRVTVLTSHREGLEREEQHGQLRIVRVPVWMRAQDTVASHLSMFSFFPQSLRYGRRVVRDHSIDLVHSFFAIPTGPSGIWLSRKADCPHILSVLGGDIYDPSKPLSPHKTPILRQVVRWVVQQSDIVVAESEDIAERTRAFYAERSVERVPLALAPPQFKAVTRSELDLGLQAEDQVVVTVGRLIPRKAVDELIEAVAQSDNTRIRLVVIGDGPLREILEQQARRLGAAGRIRFAGYVSDERKWQILANSDLYVSTSHHEGFGISYLEALCMGLPVVCYNCGGQVDFLTEEVARVHSVGEQVALRRSMEQLLADPSTLSRMSSAARREAEKYEIGAFTERYLELYSRCLTSERRNRNEDQHAEN